MNRTKISWCAVPGYQPCTEQLVAGCSPVSPACEHCYAAAGAHRMSRNPNEATAGRYRGLVTEGGHWTGEVRLLEKKLVELEWEALAFNAWKHEAHKLRAKPRSIFWCSMGDLFHEAVPAWFIRKAYAAFAMLRRDLHIICTKRPERIVPVLYGEEDGVACYKQGEASPNVWHLTTVENQACAERRVPELLRLRRHGPWPVLGVSCEPLLGAVDLNRIHAMQRCQVNAQTGQGIRTLCDRCGSVHNGTCTTPYVERGLDWVIVGGETGAGARLMNTRWLLRLREQCEQASGVAFYLKQLGDAWPARDRALVTGEWRAWPESRPGAG